MNLRQPRTLLATGLVAAVVVACNGENLFTDPVTANPDRPRVLEVTVPSSIRANEILNIRFTASSNSGIVSADVAAEGDVVQDTVLRFDPPETALNELIQFRMPESITRDAIRVRVEVQDRLGARSEPVQVDVPVTAGGG